MTLTPTILEAPAASNAAVAYLAGLAPSSRTTQAKSLRTVCQIVGGPEADPATFQWHRIGYAHSQALRWALSERYAPATANRLLAAWRGVLKAAWRLEQIDDAAYLHAVDVKDVKLSGELRGRALGADERTQLFEHARADTRPLGQRDAALFVCLYACGLRRAEACALEVSDLTPEGVRVVGKGGKFRLIPVPPAYGGMLLAYAGTLTPGPLLRAVDRQTGALSAHRLTVDGVTKALAARLHAAGLATATPHDLRRSYITDLLDKGVDPLTVAGLAGHARIDTTRRYDRRAHATRVTAVATLD